MNGAKDHVNSHIDVAAEVEHLLDELLGRKTNQGLILAYLGQLYQCNEEPAKEHSIAVDALGRGPDFDPKREAIVRVEVHKLRRTLKAYYAGPGRDRPVHVGLALGKYALVAERTDNGDREHVVQEIPAVSELVLPPRRRTGPSKPLTWVVLCAVLGAGIFFAVRRYQASDAEAPEPEVHAAVAAATDSVRILAGPANRRYVDSTGQEWSGDRYFSGGRAVDTSTWISNTPDHALYKGRREGDFLYEIPLSPGDYEVRIHLAETAYGRDTLGGGGEASRIFQIRINSKVVLSSMDVLLHAGGSNLAIVKVFPGQRPEADGKLRIRFESNSNDKAIVNAIEIVPGLKDKMLPFRIAAGAPHASVDGQGRMWLPDRYVTGGRTVERLKPVLAENPELFRFERFGRFEYNLPGVPGHQFQLKLWMAEQYFGVYTPAGDRPRRVFDLFSNGAALLRDFSIMDAAGGPAKSVQRIIPHVTPDAQGNIRLLFTPSVNYAALNALELVDEGPVGRFR